jgi:hypothetical protein
MGEAIGGGSVFPSPFPFGLDNQYTTVKQQDKNNLVQTAMVSIERREGE